MPSVSDLLRAFDHSMVPLEVGDDFGGPVLENLWWRTEAGPLYWLYRIMQRHLTHLGAPNYHDLSTRTPDGLACTGLMWLRGKIVHADWDFQVIEIEYHRSGGLVLFRPQSDGSYSDVKTPQVTVEIPYPAWRALDTLPAHAPDPYGRDRIYQEHVAGQVVPRPLRAAERFLRTLPAD